MTDKHFPCDLTIVSSQSFVMRIIPSDCPAPSLTQEQTLFLMLPTDRLFKPC